MAMLSSQEWSDSKGETAVHQIPRSELLGLTDSLVNKVKVATQAGQDEIGFTIDELMVLVNTFTVGELSASKQSAAATRTAGKDRHAHQVIYANFDSEPTSGQRVDPKETPMVESLTKRELQLLELISCGHTNREIAEKLFISEQTVKWHLNKVYAKMGVKNRTTAVAMARNYRMI